MTGQPSTNYIALLQEYLDELEEFSESCTARYYPAPAGGRRRSPRPAKTPARLPKRAVRGFLILDQPHKTRVVPEFVPDRHQG